MGAKYFKGPVTFVLGGSGHIAGIVNSPSNHKYGYQCLDKDTTISAFDNALAWLKEATSYEGSWWPHWTKWLMGHAGNKVNKRVPGMGTLKIIQDAPGDYVRKKIE